MYEALLEGWKKDIHNVWWIIDYNRQSLDSVISDRLFGRIDQLFENMGWRVVTMKYGTLLEKIFKEPGGTHYATGSIPVLILSIPLYLQRR